MTGSAGQLAEIRAAILAAYGSLDEPSFRAVRLAPAAPPFREVADAFGRGFAVEDDTDPNIDVARVLVLRRGAGHWAVSLSLVGPYACVLRVETADGQPRATLLEAPGPDAGEAALFDTLAEHGFRVLPRADWRSRCRCGSGRPTPRTCASTRRCSPTRTCCPGGPPSRRWPNEPLRPTGALWCAAASPLHYRLRPRLNGGRWAADDLLR